MAYKRHRFRQDELVEQVAHLVESKNLSVTQIANKTGLAKTTINNILSRKTRQPQPSTLRFILKCYGMEIGIKRQGYSKWNKQKF